MQRNLKFHAIAIGIICLVVIALYVAIGPSASGPVQQRQPQPGERQVKIHSASWGMNCNEEIDRVTAESSATVQRDAAGNIVLPKRYTKAQPNNVLTRAGQLCDGRYTCDLRADSAILNLEPMDLCYKDLVITYRCEAFDRPTTLTINQGDTVTIDCLKHATAPAAAQ